MSLFGKKTESSPDASKGPMEPPRARSGYGIDDAIRLMRTLPVDQNPDLIVHVIKNTLESVNVRLPDIVQEASSKQEVIRSRIAELQSEIGQLDQEVTRRRHDITALEADLAETTMVKERLELADTSKKSARVPPPAPQREGSGGKSLETGSDQAFFASKSAIRTPSITRPSSLAFSMTTFDKSTSISRAPARLTFES